MLFEEVQVECPSSPFFRSDTAGCRACGVPATRVGVFEAVN